ncbi:MAG: tetratricopeptide repeat protein [Bacteroidota bacterium]
MALVSEYEAMSQKGTVGFFEEKVFFKIIEYYQKADQLDRAIEVADHALGQYTYSVEFYLLKSQMLLEKGCKHLALSCLERAEIFAPQELELHLLRAEVFTAMGYTEDAFAILERIKDDVSDEQLCEIFFCEACIHEHLEQFDSMFFALRDAILADPSNKSVIRRLWLSVEMSGAYAESIELYQFLIDKDPYCYISWYNLGHAYYCLKDFEHAAQAFEYAYLIDETFEFAYRDCADAWIKLKEYGKALACYEEALGFVEPDSDLYLHIGYCYECLQDIGLAYSFYRKAIHLKANNDTVYFRLGECYASEKKWGNAIRAYHKAIEIDSRKEEYLKALAEAYYQVDEPEKARQLFKKAADTAPEYSEYWIHYASFLMDINEVDGALAVLDEAGYYAPGVDLEYCRVACLFMLDRRQEALYLLSEVLTEDFKSHDTLFEWVPGLENDLDVQSVLAAYQMPHSDN